LVTLLKHPYNRKVIGSLYDLKENKEVTASALEAKVGVTGIVFAGMLAERKCLEYRIGTEEVTFRLSQEFYDSLNKLEKKYDGLLLKSLEAGKVVGK